MANNYIYILTDSNRSCLHVGMAEDLNNAINTCKTIAGFFLDACSKVSRLVYYENCHSEEVAIRRFQDLSTYTRMQKEKLIRKHNPNWVDFGRQAKPLNILKPSFTSKACVQF